MLAAAALLERALPVVSTRHGQRCPGLTSNLAFGETVPHARKETCDAFPAAQLYANVLV